MRINTVILKVISSTPSCIIFRQCTSSTRSRWMVRLALCAIRQRVGTSALLPDARRTFKRGSSLLRNVNAFARRPNKEEPRSRRSLCVAVSCHVLCDGTSTQSLCRRSFGCTGEIEAFAPIDALTLTCTGAVVQFCTTKVASAIVRPALGFTLLEAALSASFSTFLRTSIRFICG